MIARLLNAPHKRNTELTFARVEAALRPTTPPVFPPRDRYKGSGWRAVCILAQVTELPDMEERKHGLTFASARMKKELQVCVWAMESHPPHFVCAHDWYHT